MTIEKTVTGVDGDTTPPFLVDAAGDVISYSILVTNTGNQTLTGVSVSDPRIANLDCDPNTAGNQTTGFTLAPTGTLTCTGSYTVTQADIDDNGGGDGDIDNTATADSDQTEPVTDSAAVPLAQSPALTIEKTVTGVDGDTTPPFLVDAAGDVISYSILVTNTGNQTLTGVSVSDPRIANLDCDPALGRQPDHRVHARPDRDADLHRDVHGHPGRHRRQRRRRRRHRQHRHRRQRPDRAGDRFGGGAAGAEPGADDREDGDRGRRGHDAAVPGRCGGRRDLLLDPGHEHGQSDADGGVGADPRIANLDCDPGTAGNQTTGFTLAPTGTLTCTGHATR